MHRWNKGPIGPFNGLFQIERTTQKSTLEHRLEWTKQAGINKEDGIEGDRF